VFALVLGGAFLWGVVSLFNRQFAAGELYPRFSTMRTDRMGTKLLYDSLGKLPGVTVERNLLPVEFLPNDGAAVVLLGLSPMQVNWNPEMLLQIAEKIAARGNRVVLGMYLDPEDNRRVVGDDVEKGPASKGKKPESSPLEAMWKVKLKIDPDPDADHAVYFEKADGWRVRESDEGRILAVERDSGKGSIVLMAESDEFTNAAVVETDGLDEICSALGPYRRILFDEQHLGVAESGSVVGMARQFRLMGLALGLALVAALFIWKNAAGFPPPPAARAIDRFAGRTSHAGLVTLLKRHVPPGELARVCWNEWLSANRGQATPEIRKQAEAILARGGGAVEATREIQGMASPAARPPALPAKGAL
jgi:hypothetical protein